MELFHPTNLTGFLVGGFPRPEHATCHLKPAMWTTHKQRRHFGHLDNSFQKCNFPGKAGRIMIKSNAYIRSTWSVVARMIFAGNVRPVSSLQGLLEYQQLEVTNLKHRNRAHTNESSKYQGQSCKSKFGRKCVADGFGSVWIFILFFIDHPLFDFMVNKLFTKSWLPLVDSWSPLASAKCTDTSLLLGSDEQPLLWCALAFIGTFSIHTFSFFKPASPKIAGCPVWTYAQTIDSLRYPESHPWFSSCLAMRQSI